MDKLLNTKQVCEQLSIGKTALWAGVNSGRLPGPVRVMDRMTRWKQSDIDDYIRSLNPDEFEKRCDLANS